MYQSIKKPPMPPQENPGALTFLVKFPGMLAGLDTSKSVKYPIHQRLFKYFPMLIYEQVN